MRRSFLAGASLFAFAFPSALAAQDIDEDEINSNVIVVTAQRVEQNIQDVPISVTAIGGEALQTRQIDSFDQLQFIAPGVNFNAGINARQSATTIRGIGTSLFNIGIEASTAIVIDGVVMGREGAGIFDFADVERVEILRGPQGTLFGKNASAGVISVITKGPTDTFKAEANVAYGSFDELNLFAAVSGPIAGPVTARLSGYRNTRDGFVRNVNPNAPQERLNDRDEFGFRGKFNLEIAPGTDLLLSGDYVERDQASGASTLRSFSPGGPGTGLLGFGVPVTGPASTALGIVPGPQNLEIGSEAAYLSQMDAWSATAQLTTGIGDHELVSLTSYREWNSLDNNDADLIPQPLLAINLGDLAQSQFSQEIRLVSPRGRPFTYTLGAFYFEQDIAQDNIQGGTAGLNLLGALPPGVQIGTLLESDFSEKNYAIFGQGEYEVSEALTLIAGFRVLRSEVFGSQLKSVAPGFAAPFAGQVASTALESAQDKDTALVWRLGAQYFVDDNTNLFATVTRGYKAAGVVQGLTVRPIQGQTLPTVRPEVPTQYEVGIRHRSDDGRVTANLTGFFTQIDDFQAQTLIPDPSGTAIFTVANAGKVETYGFEAELTVIPVEGLTLSGSVAYTNATFAEFPNAPCYQLQTAAQGCTVVSGQRVQDLEGATLANAPELVANGLARYDFDFGGETGGFAQIGVQFRGDAQSTILNDPNTIIEAYTLVDAQIGVDLLDDRVRVVGFVRNLFDESFVEAIFGTPFDTGGYSQFLSLEAQRTWGVRLSLSY
ncbi:MAG: TonB-dependent receptor [Erythrobacter sp.]|jgi:iron complex outermembrane receptor protein|nr:TonB-dependent receptor [Erythrobacter sp.]